MNQETLGLIRDKLVSIDRHLERLTEVIEKHEERDARYWQKIDAQDGQISLLKWMFSGAIAAGIAGVGSWLMTKLGLS